MKYSIILPYWNRFEHLTKTLESYQRLYEGRSDYEVIVVLDNKNTLGEKYKVEKLIYLYQDYMNTFIVENKEDQLSAEPSINLGVYYSVGEFVVISNAEIYHETNILKGLDEEFDKDKNSYIHCGCKALNPDGSFHSWYQHSIESNRYLPFLASMSLENYEKIGGFSDAFSKGVWYCDDDLREQAKFAGLKFINRDDLIGCHQWHDSKHWDNLDLREVNRKIYEQRQADRIRLGRAL